jgi:hypothetical protein
MNRKEFIRVSGRWMILSVVAAFSAGLILRRRISLENNCSISDHCRECVSVLSCNLPKAIKFRKDEKEKGI